MKVRLRAGLTARQAGDGNAAERMFREVLNTHPGQPDALNLLGVLLAESGRISESVILLRQAAAVRPKSISIQVNLAQALLAADRPSEAVRVLTALPAPDAGARGLLVRALLADRRPEEAAAGARKALCVTPDCPELLTALGDALVQSGCAADALPHYEAAIAAAPSYGPAYNNLGTALEKLDRLAQAAAAFQQALDCMPDHGAARTNLGTVQLRMGEAAGAEQTFAAVLRREPFNQRAIAYIAVARQQCGTLTPQAARAAVEGLIYEEPLVHPAPFGTRKEFHDALTTELTAHPNRRRDVSGTATTGGFDALRLFDHEAPALDAFERQLRGAIDRHIARLPHAEGHPFLGRRSRRYTLDVWATFLESGGYQHPHIHPSGWISGVYYVQTPSSECGRPDGGWIEFNRPDESFGYTFAPAVIQKKPAPGVLLMFPSYVYHRTLPFESGTDRISIAFDVKPVP